MLRAKSARNTFKHQALALCYDLFPPFRIHQIEVKLGHPGTNSLKGVSTHEKVLQRLIFISQYRLSLTRKRAIYQLHKTWTASSVISGHSTKIELNWYRNRFFATTTATYLVRFSGAQARSTWSLHLCQLSVKPTSPLSHTYRLKHCSSPSHGLYGRKFCILSSHSLRWNDARNWRNYWMVG